MSVFTKTVSQEQEESIHGELRTVPRAGVLAGSLQWGRCGDRAVNQWLMKGERWEHNSRLIPPPSDCPYVESSRVPSSSEAL